MGDNIYLGDRNGVRTPMQWTGDRNARLLARRPGARSTRRRSWTRSTATRRSTSRRRSASPFSLLHWMKRMIALRKQHQVFGRGTIEFLQPREPQGARRTCARDGDETILCRRQPRRAPCSRSSSTCRAFEGLTPVEMLGPHRVPAHRRAAVLPDARPVRASTGSALVEQPRRRSPRALAPEPHDRRAATLPALLVGARLGDAARRQRPHAHRARLPAAVPAAAALVRRQGATRARGARFVDWGAAPARAAPGRSSRSSRSSSTTAAASSTSCRSPICAHGDAKGARRSASPHAVLARITGARKGVLFDAWRDERFARALLDAHRARGRRRRRERGTRRAAQTTALAGTRGGTGDDLRVYAPAARAEQHLAGATATG